MPGRGAVGARVGDIGSPGDPNSPEDGRPRGAAGGSVVGVLRSSVVRRFHPIAEWLVCETPGMAGGLQVVGDRVRTCAGVVASAGAEITPAGVQAAASRVGGAVPGSQTTGAFGELAAEVEARIRALSRACAAWSEDVGAALREFEESDEYAADRARRMGRPV